MTTTGKLLDKAKKMADAAAVKAIEINVPMVIAVCDNAGKQVLLNRMEDSLLASIDIATNKAYTSVALKMSTDAAADLCKESGSLFGLATCDKGRMVVFGGGFPIKCDGQIIGGIGVSGGTVEEDMIVANAGLAAIE
ncbi:GlcG/HbpS family heme-binding protein [Acetobacterium sp. K1/6]|uniref:GlcG/HbpS family heme-binding protein n=1 Tax=Acetobacterium sp. K1/6 TaxID=3055467 RepID=UPI002ACA6C54|nr:heme-binding protein [Acetobacterium sp. K1/6]MDZ5723414.1 heme-binding protein [Acetobacterium sp. K1/6]